MPSDQGPCRDIARQLVDEYPDIRVSGCGDGDDDDYDVVVVVVVEISNNPHHDWEANVPSDQGPCRDIARQLVEEYDDISVGGYSDGDDDDDVVVVVMVVVMVVEISNTLHLDWEATKPSDQGACIDIASWRKTTLTSV